MNTENNLITMKTLAGRNMLEFSYEDEQEIVAYQLEMLANNHVPGLLKSEAMRVDGIIRLSYDITSLVPLKKLFERREIGRHDFLQLIRQIVAVMEGLDEYLLDIGGLVFDSRYIFVDPKDLRVSFAYQPLREMPQSLEALKSLLLDTIIHEIRFINEASDNFVQKLIEILKAQELDIMVFKNYIKTMEAKPTALPPKALAEKSPACRPEPSSPAAEKKPIISIPAKKFSQPAKAEVPPAARLCYPVKSVVVLCSVVAAFIVFGIVLSFTDTFSPGNPDFILSLFGYLMIGGALIYLVYSKLFTADKRIEGKAEHPAAKPQQIPVKQMEYVNKAFTFPVPDIFKAGTEAAPSLNIQDRTVILDVKSLEHPSLKGIHDNISEAIVITRFPFMLGRLEGQVDYCLKNPAVGKLHAEIKKTPEGFFITDMNTRNGTHLNGQRLDPSREYRLSGGDRITFANEEFIFSEGIQT